MDEETESNRVACPNDLCTGALDRDGRCGTCAMVFAQYARPESAAEPAESDAEASSDPAAMPEAPAVSDEGDAPSDEAREAREAGEEGEAREEGERVCCPDDLCTGAIGADGRCGTCGRSELVAPEEP